MPRRGALAAAAVGGACLLLLACCASPGWAGPAGEAAWRLARHTGRLTGRRRRRHSQPPPPPLPTAGRQRGAHRRLLQAKPPSPAPNDSLIGALGGISGDLPGVELQGGDASDVLPGAPAPAPAPDSSAGGATAAPTDPNAAGALPADGGPPPCTGKPPTLHVTRAALLDAHCRRRRVHVHVPTAACQSPSFIHPLSHFLHLPADPSLLVSTMSTFCRLGSLEELRSLRQDAVQACCRLTSATLQPNCWDACAPPPAVSAPVLVSGRSVPSH